MRAAKPILIRSKRLPAASRGARKWPSHMVALFLAVSSTGLWSLMMVGVNQVIS